MQTAYTFLDIRGLALKALLGGNDPDGPLDENGKVQNTATYGFSIFMERAFLPALKITPSRSVIAVWDGGNDFRKGIYPGYKKKRGERVYSEVQTKEIDRMMTAVERLLNYSGCLQCKVPGVEADDVISFLDDRLPGHHYVHTVDADLAQMDDEDTDVIYQEEMIKVSGYGEEPRYVALRKSLIGDTSDEYPGVSGFGEVKYNAIIEEFGRDSLGELLQAVQTQDLSALYEAAGYAQNAQAKKGLELVIADHQNWYMCYELACLHPELCEGRWGNAFAEVKWDRRLPSSQFTYTVLKDMNCTEYFSQLQDELPTQTLVTADNWDEFVEDFMSHFEATAYFPFDYESYDVLQHEPFNRAKKSAGDYVDVLSQSITGMSITYGINLQHTVYISTDHVGTNNVEDMKLKDLLVYIQENGKHLVAHNAPFEIALTDTNFLHLLDPVICTRLLSANIDENDSHHLKALSKRYLKYQQSTYKETLEKGGADNMHELTGEQVVSYGCDDSAVTAALVDLFMIISHLEQTAEFLPNESATDLVLYNGFESGLNIDFDRLEVMRGEDALTYETDMAALRSLLAMNCKGVHAARAAELYNELSEYTANKMRMDGKAEEAINRKLAVMHENMVRSTAYEPYIEVAREVKFVPTPLQISKVAGLLGIQSSLKGVTASKITEFLVTAEEELSDREDVNPARTEFLQALAAASSEIKKRQGEAYDAFYSICINLLSDGAPVGHQGDELNLDSPVQMQQLLYCKMGLPIRLYSKMQPGSTREKLGYRSGGPATDSKAVDTALAEDAPVGDWRREALIALKEAGAAHTRRKNYWVPYPLWKHPRDGAVHGGITNLGTRTRRFTGSNPNELQLTSKDGGRVRSMIVPRREGHVILSPDLNGEELRITASMSNDPIMVDAYIGPNPRDLHSITALAISETVLRREMPDLLSQIQFQEINGLQTMVYDEFVEALGNPDKEIAGLFKNIRKLAKGVNFLLLYVGGPSTLARNLGIPTDVAAMFLEAAMTTYPGLGPWQKSMVEFARTHGYALTAYGNRRHLGEGLFSQDGGIRSRLERQAVNAPVQGTGSDIMKVIMKGMYDTRLLAEVDGRLLVPPYDEVAVSVPRSAAWECWLRMQEIMTLTPPGHVVPQLPELKASALNWGSCIELGAFPTEAEFDEAMDKQLFEEKAA